jgi:hypothetical protein
MPPVRYQLITDSPIGAVLGSGPSATPPCATSRKMSAIRPGDRITGKVRIAGIEGTGTWVVVEHDRLCHLPLKPIWPSAGCGSAISWTPWRRGTRFRRDLNGPGLGPNLVAVMNAQSAAG